ncbi:hypothetical protein [Zunongwangia pacifica]|uniref:Uncharacterized protein n=1 Tax=Zunongwangia pacifica TaxID=2911062 RepID=A0A9X2CNR0_9FLAO|nr:hypothetical protein [Zunongwangia pacifica]MCL6220830.1 hypothetical protein [Zunongwangia pacifica]
MAIILKSRRSPAQSPPPKTFPFLKRKCPARKNVPVNGQSGHWTGRWGLFNYRNATTVGR